MSDDAGIRDWLREQGDEVSVRGPISRAQRNKYELAHPPAADYPDGMTDSDFDVSEPGPPPPDTEPSQREARPRTIAAPRGPSRFRLGRGKQPAKPGAKKKRGPRVPVDDVISTVWRGLAGMARPLPATSRLLKIQAPVAGILLEDAVKDTVVDRILQPIARTTKGAEAVAVLIGPPAIVTAMQLNPQSVPFLMPALRDLLLRMVAVAGPKMAEAMKTEKEFEANFGGSVDDLIAFLLEPVTVLDGETPEQAEEAAVRRVQESMQGAAA